MKVCLDCATNGKMKWLPCEHHKPAISPDNCQHENTSQTLTHNGLRDDELCHDCGILLIWSGVRKASA